MFNKLTLSLSLLLSLLLLSSCNNSSSRNDFVVNKAPIIGDVFDLEILANEDSSPIAISISDEATADADLTITLNSSNQTVISNDGLILTEINDGVAELTLRPNLDAVGQTVITLGVIDAGGFTASTSFTVNVVAQQVSAATFIRTIFAEDENSIPTSINAIELIQDVTDENEFDDLIDS